MRKLYILPILFILLAAASCGGGPSSGGAKKVADLFTRSLLVEFDMDKARRYVSDDLKEDFPSREEMNNIEKPFYKMVKEHTKSYGYKFALNEERTEIGEDKAYVEYVFTARGNPDYKESGYVSLEKREDKWIVVGYSFDRDEDAMDFSI